MEEIASLRKNGGLGEEVFREMWQRNTMHNQGIVRGGGASNASGSGGVAREIAAVAGESPENFA